MNFKNIKSQVSRINNQVESFDDKSISDIAKSLQENISIYWEYVTGDDGIKPNKYTISNGFIYRQDSKCQVVLGSARELKFKICLSK